jgi:hypothetical protein
MNITRKDLPRAGTQAQSEFNCEFLKVFNQCKRRPSNIEVLKETLKVAHRLCGEFEKDQKVRAEKRKKQNAAVTKAKADAQALEAKTKKEGNK